ncbi:MAG: MFS transporter, partial [Verrucomicrobiae bacterium]|nr:MFS transporter [Verrucomicrobiae bacterium]NNJ86221.1 MFS transporter [Akkermansiaceae bacterium]
IGDVLTNPKTVLTWLLSQLGTTGFFIGMLAPIRESGSMLPQLFISGWVKRARNRKWVFVAGALAQSVCIAAMGISAILMPPDLAGGVVLLALVAFSLSRALCSISSKDVLARTIPKGFRGRISGASATISGIISAMAAACLIFYRNYETASLLAWIILGASLLWVLGAGIYSLVREPVPEPEEKDAGPNKPLLAGVKERMALVIRDPLFRRFIIVRSLLLGSALASPLIVVLAQTKDGTLVSLVGFLFASALATTASSFLWGKLADRASYLSMAIGGFCCAVIGLGSISIVLWMPAFSRNQWLWPLVFLLFNLGYTGVRLGRKVWVVDAVEGDKRTDYVSTSNTLIAVIILAMGLVTAPLQAISPLLPLGVYSLLCLTGCGLAITLKGASR